MSQLLHFFSNYFENYNYIKLFFKGLKYLNLLQIMYLTNIKPMFHHHHGSRSYGYLSSFGR